MYYYDTVLVHQFHYVELFRIIRRKILTVAQTPKNVNVRYCLFMESSIYVGPLRTVLLSKLKHIFF